MPAVFNTLKVFQCADELVHTVFDVTKTFPREELFSTTSQIRRAALSIVLNIVEGSGKRSSSKKEFCRFLIIAFGSLYELEYLAHFSLKRGFIHEQNFHKLDNQRNKCGALLWKLIVSEQRRF